MTQTTLYYREGSSDKIYQAFIETTAEGCHVRFAYGRRGSTLNTGTKTTHPVTLGEAAKILEKLVRSKLAKGYTPGEDEKVHSSSGNDGKDSGIRCQLLNPVEEGRLATLLRDDRWCLQEKFDGRRMMIRKTGDTVTGINRRGLVIAVPEPIERTAREIPFDFLIDGEAVGDVLHVFDLLGLRGTDLRPMPYRERLARLVRWINPGEGIQPVRTTMDTAGKQAMFHALRREGREGAVIKDLHASASAGRPASSGSQLKFKFTETASFIVASVHPKKRSVALELADGNGKPVPAGNVTIPPNHDIPAPGTIIEARYLYTYEESGSIYQPVFLGVRDDIAPSECTTSQLKFKRAPQEEAA
ncbi:MAG: WGR domain-containing protein [Akkermansiaceae bacterium]|nr:WGR domain-containing protein [Akkermansiaceae bacterium]